MDRENIKFNQNEYGFFEVENKPSAEELQEFYANKYYQSEQGNYQKKYSEQELKFFLNKDTEKKIVIENISGLSQGEFLDIGCGEGFTLKHFENFGWNVTGTDFSSFGCENQNPEQVKNLVTGDIYDSLRKFIDEGRSFDVVWMNNLLEHVIDPLDLLNDTRKLIKDNGTLVIQVPNDFSFYQKFLKEQNYIDEQFWVAFPDHLNYFTRESLKNFCESNGWEEKHVLSDFPIDLFLTNEHSNYIKDRSKGKEAHKTRVQLDNLFHQNDPQKTVRLYEAMADLGFGRQIIGFFQKK